MANQEVLTAPQGVIPTYRPTKQAIGHRLKKETSLLESMPLNLTNYHARGVCCVKTKPDLLEPTKFPNKREIVEKYMDCFIPKMVWLFALLSSPLYICIVCCVICIQCLNYVCIAIQSERIPCIMYLHHCFIHSLCGIYQQVGMLQNIKW